MVVGRFPHIMAVQLDENRLAAPIDGSDTLEVRQRYLRARRRRLTDRGWVAMWVTVGALVGWLFIVAFAAIGH